MSAFQKGKGHEVSPSTGQGAPPLHGPQPAARPQEAARLPLPGHAQALARQRLCHEEL